MTHDDVLDKAVIYDSVVFTPEDDGECLYCGADCGVPEAKRRHAEDCPFSTGLWPIQGGVVSHFMCDGCGEEHTARYACPRCDRYFDEDDVYRVVDSETQLLITYAVSPSEGIGICIECAEKQSNALRKLMR